MKVIALPYRSKPTIDVERVLTALRDVFADSYVAGSAYDAKRRRVRDTMEMMRRKGKWVSDRMLKDVDRQEQAVGPAFVVVIPIDRGELVGEVSAIRVDFRGECDPNDHRVLTLCRVLNSLGYGEAVIGEAWSRPDRPER